MNKQSIFFTILTAFLSIAILILALQFITKKLNIISTKDNNCNVAYSIWLSSIVISFVLYLKIALNQIENSIEIFVQSNFEGNSLLAIMEKISIYVGFTFIFTLSSYFLINIIMKFFMGVSEVKVEIEKNNMGYFIIKGAVLLSFVFSLLNIFEHFINWFAPYVETPFYH